MTTQELAQKILEMIAEAEKSLRNKPDQLFLVSLDVDTLQLLKNNIEQLCQQESRQENIDWQEYARQLYETLDGVLTLFVVGNSYNYDYTCVQKALELFKRGHQWWPLTLAFAKKIEEEQHDPTTQTTTASQPISGSQDETTTTE